uniref:Uncharacterized protein n=1 Tax=Riboviria sp. TaxID=2585031 RepID=A0A8K1U2Q9_9VIRU|nr:MAG: hypothetical protein 2 [Riboviria sp.]
MDHTLQRSATPSPGPFNGSWLTKLDVMSQSIGSQLREWARLSCVGLKTGMRWLVGREMRPAVPSQQPLQASGDASLSCLVPLDRLLTLVNQLCTYMLRPVTFMLLLPPALLIRSLFLWGLTPTTMCATLPASLALACLLCSIRSTLSKSLELTETVSSGLRTIEWYTRSVAAESGNIMCGIGAVTASTCVVTATLGLPGILSCGIWVLLAFLTLRCIMCGLSRTCPTAPSCGPSPNSRPTSSGGSDPRCTPVISPALRTGARGARIGIRSSQSAPTEPNSFPLAEKARTPPSESQRLTTTC